VELRAIDRAGNTGELSASREFTIDLSTPAPTVERVADAKGVTLANPTNTNSVILYGTAESGASVRILVDGVVAGTSTATTKGQWSFTLPALPAEGDRAFTVVATDIADNKAELGSPVRFTFDRTAPGLPVTGTGSTSGLTNNPVVTVVGTSEAGSKVEIYLGTTLVASTTTGVDGRFSATTSALPDGSHTLKAKATDAAGNASALADSAQVQVDTKTDKPSSLRLVNDTGRKATDGITNASAIVVSGQAEPGANVSIFEGRTLLASANADSKGAFSIDISATASEGSHTLTARAVDLAGNQSADSDNLVIRIDRTAPGAPAITAIQDDTGTAGDYLTRATKITVSGTAEPDALVVLSQDGVDVGTVVAGLDGAWSIPVGGSKGLAQGLYTFKARSTDVAGNTGAESAGRQVEIDTSVAAPKVSGLTDTSGGPISALITNTGAIGLRGTAEAGSTIDLLVQGIQVGTTLADGAGNWTLVLATPLGQGNYTAQARATDRAGNISSLSASLAFTIDLTAPDAPLVSGIKPDTGSSATDGLTSSTAPTASGTAEAGSTVEMSIDGGAVVTAKASAKEAWVFTLPTLSEGKHQVVFWAVDAAGNRSKASQTLQIEVDTVAPAQPVVTGIQSDTGASASDGVTADSTPLVTGTAEAGSLVDLFRNGTKVARVQADGTGAWQYQVDVALSEGKSAFTAQAMDQAGNKGALSTAFNAVIDTKAPASGLVTGISPDTGTAGDGLTSTSAPVVSGTGEKGSTAIIAVDGVEAGRSAIGSDGKWSFNLPTLNEGANQVTVTVQDLAGNLSPVSANFTVRLDTQAPGAPAITGISSDTGRSDTDFITKSTAFSLLVTAEPGSKVEAVLNGVVIGTAFADAAGNALVPVKGLAAGDQSFTVRATDPAANVSSASQARVVTIDLQAPASPTGLGILTDTGASTTDGVTRDPAITVKGTAEPDSAVEVILAGVSRQAIADGQGVWQVGFTDLSFADGSYQASVSATDVAGNRSAKPSTFTIRLDTQSPAVEVKTMAPDTGASSTDGVTSSTTPIFTGTAEPGVTIRLLDAQGAILIAGVADSRGAWSLKAPALAEGAQTLTFQVEDLAGNTQVATRALVVDKTAPNLAQVQSITPDTGVSATDSITSAASVELAGTAEADSQLRIFVQGKQVGSATADSQGAWKHTIALAADGKYTVDVQSTDLAGNSSKTTGALVITRDSKAPGAPLVATFGPDTGSSATDGITSATHPVLTGTAEANAWVNLVFTQGTQTVTGLVQATAAGDWSFQPATALAEGVWQVSITADDTAGNRSASTQRTFTIDSVAPAQAVVDGILDGNLLDADQLTSDLEPRLRGSAEPGTTVTIELDGVKRFTTTADPQGVWQVRLTGLADGSHTAVAWATDKAGNQGANSSTSAFSRDTTAPGAPTLDRVTPDTGVRDDDGITSATTLDLDGRAEAGATLLVVVDDQVASSLVVGSSGAWTTRISNLAEGKHTLDVQIRDAAGNRASGGARTVWVDVTAPQAPVFVSLVEDTGTSSTDRLTRVAPLAIRGTGEPGAFITLYGPVAAGGLPARAGWRG